MTAANSTNQGQLVLLGGEGLRADMRALWEGLGMPRPAPERRVVIVPAALAGEKVGTPERHAGLAGETLQRWGIPTEVALIVSPEDANDDELIEPLRQASAVYLPGGDARATVEVLAGSAAWRLIRQVHRAGTTLVAASGAAVALGEMAFAPRQPAPPTLDALSYETFSGLGLLPGVVVLPYFSWLQEPLVRQVEALCPTGVTLAGLDDQAALIAAGGEWHVTGLGTVTIWQKGQRRYVIDAGRSVPADLLPTYQTR
ncbi:MAG: Type 1 glutamine amidotransferase-like domain-containing protein [Aggregatilineales bacterium]